MSEIHSEWLQLQQGPRAWYARPQGTGPYPAIVVFIEAFGVNAHFQDVAERLAKAGYCAIVPDFYHGKVALRQIEWVGGRMLWSGRALNRS